jgi:choline dehydrogenase-like flavoprotein
LAAIGSARQPGSIAQHLWNVLRDAPAVSWFVPSFFVRRYVNRRRLPGFFVYSASNTYALHYHAEQVPNPESRIALSDERDQIGMRRAVIDLRYSEQDIDSVIRTHRLLDGYLRRLGAGQLAYWYDDLPSAVMRQAADGLHQIGTTRMAQAPSDGVVDPDCRVHGTRNLYVCSSSVFPTSGQANCTLPTLALAARLAAHLAR